MILVVDDERLLAELLRNFLRIGGFEATVFTAGRDAVAWAEAHQADVELVFLDLRMPDMTGVECFERLSKVVPEAPVAIVSGFAEDSIVRSLRARGVAAVFEKPFNWQELVRFAGEVRAERERRRAAGH